MDIVQALEAKLTARQTGKVARIYSRKQVEQAILETFELVGGVPRLAIWANDPDNYGEFLKLFAKLAPREEHKDIGQVIEYRSNVPPSPLNHFELSKHEHIEDGEVIDDGVQGQGEEEEG